MPLPRCISRQSYVAAELGHARRGSAIGIRRRAASRRCLCGRLCLSLVVDAFERRRMPPVSPPPLIAAGMAGDEAPGADFILQPIAMPALRVASPPKSCECLLRRFIPLALSSASLAIGDRRLALAALCHRRRRLLSVIRFASYRDYHRHVVRSPAISSCELPQSSRRHLARGAHGVAMAMIIA